MSVIVPYAILSARSVATLLPAELSRLNVRDDGWSTTTSPGPGNPLSRQCPLDMTRAGSVGWESGTRTTDPEQLLSATVPAKVTALALALASCWAPTAVAGAAVAPMRSRPNTAPTRGLFMWGVLSR